MCCQFCCFSALTYKQDEITLRKIQTLRNKMPYKKLKKTMVPAHKSYKRKGTNKHSKVEWAAPTRKRLIAPNYHKCHVSRA